jgi:protein ImuB
VPAALALWALRFTPLVAASGEDTLLLDVTGCAHLHGGEAALRQAVLDGLARLGVQAEGALASAPGTALALARAGWGGVVPPGGEAAAIAPLPLNAMRVEPEVVAGLARLGLRCIGQVRCQPRAALARRFGKALLLALDEAAGEATRPISPVRPPPELEAAQGFLEPVLTREAIDHAVAGLVERLCVMLTHAGRGVRRVVLRAHRVDGAVQELAVGAGMATRDAAHLLRLFAHRLERLEPGFGFEHLALAAETTERLGGVQAVSFGEARQEVLSQLLDRLSQRLSVWRLAPRLSHWPEREVAPVSAFEAVAVPEGWPARPRPVRLLHRPLEAQAMALLPDAPPSLLRLGRQAHRVLHAEGPERLEGEWWREDRHGRDYYRLELATGARLWVCRIGFGAEARWFVHGYL